MARARPMDDSAFAAALGVATAVVLRGSHIALSADSTSADTWNELAALSVVPLFFAAFVVRDATFASACATFAATDALGAIVAQSVCLPDCGPYGPYPIAAAAITIAAGCAITQLTILVSPEHAEQLRQQPIM